MCVFIRCIDWKSNFFHILVFLFITVEYLQWKYWNRFQDCVRQLNYNDICHASSLFVRFFTTFFLNNSFAGVISPEPWIFILYISVVLIFAQKKAHHVQSQSCEKCFTLTSNQIFEQIEKCRAHIFLQIGLSWPK